MERTEAAELLGVAPTASGRQIRSAFRKRVRADHPDRNSDSDTDFQRLVEARDLLLTTPPPEPKPTRPPSRPTQPKTTLTYGYEPYEEPKIEEFITRPPSASLGSQPLVKQSLLTRIQRVGWQILVMGALALLFFQLVLRGMLFPPASCVGNGGSGPISVTCTSNSELEIDSTYTDINATCPAGTDRFRVGDGLWCVRPYN